MKKEFLKCCAASFIPIFNAAFLHIIPFSSPYNNDAVDINPFFTNLVIVLFFIYTLGISNGIAAFYVSRHQSFRRLGLSRVVILSGLVTFISACIFYLQEFSWFGVMVVTAVHLTLAILIILFRFWRYKHSVPPKDHQQAKENYFDTLKR